MPVLVLSDVVPVLVDEVEVEVGSGLVVASEALVSALVSSVVVVG